MINNERKKHLFITINDKSLPFKISILICLTLEGIFIAEISNLLWNMTEINYLIELNIPESIFFFLFY